ncbi:Pirin-related protein [Candidatus Burkholderia pumila]|uniref:Pirin-related protein n=1 Tax=Candidatus Burkholderia pumila TaxID=1090375 RepID=A0ABR5HN79_9BURK|nr:Pirin-related protein [Candidatus Burkholderia pumila]
MTLRVIADTALRVTDIEPGLCGGTEFSLTLYVAASLAASAELTLDAEHEERGVYLVDGDLTVDGESVPLHQIVVLEPGKPVPIASSNGASAMILGGAKLDGTCFIEWNFASRSREKIEAAKQAWSEQRMGHVPGETEFIPLSASRREQRVPEA